MIEKTHEKPPFLEGEGEWGGVVMVERPDLSRLPYGVEPMCRVMSARTVQLAGKRAIYCELPYEMFAHQFRSDDGDCIFLEAEYKDGHLECYRRSNATLKDWVLYSQTQELVAASMKGKS